MRIVLLAFLRFPAFHGPNMTAHHPPHHPLFSDPNLGSESWWLKIENEKTPLFHTQGEKAYAIFVWKIQDPHDQVWIDVYCQSLLMQHPWQAFKRINETNIAYYEIELKNVFSSSYVIVEEPHTDHNVLKNRTWWINQLEQNSRIDPYNTQLPYQSSRGHWVNQFHFKNPENGLKKQNIKNQNIKNIQRLNHSLHDVIQEQKTPLFSYQITYKNYAIQILSNKVQSDSIGCHSLMIFLDGQLWLQPAMGIHHLLAESVDHSTKTYCYAFLSSDAQNRNIDYGCNYGFSHMLVTQIIPHIQQCCGFDQIDQTTLIGQSLGGLCALYTQLHFADVISKVIAQSASLWWQDFSLANLISDQESSPDPSLHFDNFSSYWLNQISSLPLMKLSSQNRQPISILLSAGTLEDSIQHDLSLFVQQFNACNSDPLKEKIQLHYQKFNGAHDPVHWREELISILKEQISPREFGIY